jgi:hypothetical protein
MFIKTKKEEHIKNFFLKDIDALLEKYDPGLPIMKPDVLKQIKEIDEQRAKMMEEQSKHGPIMLQRDGKEPVVLSSQEVIGIIEQQQRQLQEMGEHIQRLEMNKPGAWPPQSPFAQSPFTQNQNQSPFTQNPFVQSHFAKPPQSPFTQPPQSPFTQTQNQNQSPFTQTQNQNQSPFTQNQNQNQSPFTQNQNQSPVAQNQSTPSQYSDIVMAEQRISELEKQNIELNVKYSQNFNELQKYKRMAETQKITINNLQTEKAELLLTQKKHVTFMN